MSEAFKSLGVSGKEQIQTLIDDLAAADRKVEEEVKNTATKLKELIDLENKNRNSEYAAETILKHNKKRYESSIEGLAKIKAVYDLELAKLQEIQTQHISEKKAFTEQLQCERDAFIKQAEEDFERIKKGGIESLKNHVKSLEATKTHTEN